MNLVALKKDTPADLKDFVYSWSRFYSYANEAVYSKAIVKESYKIQDIQNLYKWKNGMELSILKQKSLDHKIIAKLTLINNYKKSDNLNLEAFKRDFQNVSSVWKIFLLHIIKPKEYPIYDQHIHRAYLFIHDQDWNNIDNTISDKAKQQFYFENYLPFIKSQNINSIKQLDEAFFAFGQFLKTRNYQSIFK